jgi:hypothetical protein
MAITKNKIQLMDKTLSLELELELDYYCYYWNYYYEDYDYDWEDEREPCWRYLETPNITYDIIETRRYRKYFKRNVMSIGKMIDMNTIYTKEKMREKKIDQILGLLPDYVNSPTLGDFFPKNK